jgi:anti-sigma factor ChrR (cupin superfamily)
VIVGLVAASSALLALLATSSAHHPSLVQPAPVPAAGNWSDLPNVGVTSEDYLPGQSSGWHRHAGVHSVVVLSGTLTIYDQDCQRRDYGPGDSYIGGQQPHLARNEGAEPVALVVTYVVSRSGVPPSATAEVPAGCAVR